MVTGRKPVASEARQARGETPRPAVLIAGRNRPAMPPGLNASMKRIWRRVVDDLAEAGVLDAADWAVVEAFVVAVARAREARELLAGRSLLTTNSQGVVANPALAIEERAWKEVRQLAEQLPLSPWGRARLNLHGSAGKNDIEDTIGPARPHLLPPAEASR